ncbi:hypothetical protein SAMN06296241_3134 [Salinimicrobium sediminis]|uniref:Uncharacterized protein n=1 Tax=Salinimicrobium sediminis TaxID=1343891 RepID=A0A285X8D5_9FLAO|nr:hypothetical protein [Salinimicrobium sediminis]SOC81555.1 hypothetical protein SAMN06296241_3134 [Salinimicrobium sediminis]
MDYNKVFHTIYDLEIKKKEGLAIKLMPQLKKDNRTFDYAHSEISQIFFEELKNCNSKSPYDLNNFSDLFSKRHSYYSTEIAGNILKNEMQELFNKSYKQESYSSFVKLFSTRFALTSACLLHKWNYDFNKYIYYNEDYKKYTLGIYKKGISNSQMLLNYLHDSSTQAKTDDKGYRPNVKDWNLIEKKLKEQSGVQITEITEKEAQKKRLNDFSSLSEEEEFEESERLILAHYLICSESASKVEKAKILSLIGETKTGHTLFKEEAKFNKYYNQIRQGPDYWGKIKREKLLLSLLETVKPLGLPTVTPDLRLKLKKISN